MAKAPVNNAARRVSKKVRKNVADGIAHVHAYYIQQNQGAAQRVAGQLHHVAQAAFVAHGGSSHTRGRYPLAGAAGNADGVKLAHIRRVLRRAGVHGVQQIERHDIHHTFPRGAQICQRVFGGAVGRLQMHNSQHRRLHAGNGKERKRRQIVHTAAAAGADPGNGPGHHAAGKQAVKVLDGQVVRGVWHSV